MEVFARILLLLGFIGSIKAQSVALTPGQMPYIVNFKNQNNIIFCSGAIYAPNVVLTAAECSSIALKGATVTAGDIDPFTFDESEQSSTVLNVTIPKDFDRPEHENDIAVVFLNTPFEFNEYVTNVTFPDRAPKTDSRVVISGYGTKRDIQATVLKGNYGTVISDDVCETDYNGAIFKYGQVCISPDSGKDACPSDDGSPAMNEGTDILVGLFSFQVGCDDPNYPNVFTEIYYYENFIALATGISPTYNDPKE